MRRRRHRALERLIGVALLAFPRAFRSRYREDALLYFRDRADALGHRFGRAAVWLLFARTVVDILVGGLRERVRSASPRGAASDVRYAVRSLARRPTFVAATSLPVALGIAGVAAVLAVVDAVLLRPLPYPEAERLVAVGRPLASGDLATVSTANMLDLVGELSTLDRVGAVQGGRIVVNESGAARMVRLSRPTAEVFDILGIAPMFGRSPTPGETHAVLVTHAFAVARWGRPEAAVGATLDTQWRGGTTLDVVGVLAPGFVPPEALDRGDHGDIWWPVDPSEPFVEITRAFGFARGVGRLAPGATLARANEELRAAAERLAEAHPGPNLNRDGSVKMLEARSLHAETVGGFGIRLVLLAGAVGALLLIACANVANLFLAAGIERERELAMRGVLGASHGHLALQLLVEATVVALIGGAIGTGLAYLSLDALVGLTPDLPRAAEIAVDLRTVAAAATVSLLSGAIFGLAPLGLVSRREPGAVLSGGRARRQGADRLRGALVVGQVALAVVLVTGGGLLVHSVIRLVATDPGFDPEDVMVIRPNPDADGVALVRDMAEVVAAVPGVERVSGSMFTPGVGLPVSVQVGTDEAPDATETHYRHSVLPGFFEVVDVPILEGRGIEPTDDATSEPVAVVSAAFARQMWGGGSPLGRRFTVREREGGELVRRTVVGVARDIRNRGAREAGEPVFWESYYQNPWLPGMALLAEVREGADVAGPVRDALASAYPSMAVEELTPLTTALARRTEEERAYAVLLTLFSAVALGIAAIGIYATISYSVTRRLGEMALRRAVGAAPRDVLALVVRRGMGQAISGVAIGVVLAAFAARVLSDLLFEITPRDPTTYGVVSGILLLVSMAACAVPARRAMRIDPGNVLRRE